MEEEKPSITVAELDDLVHTIAAKKQEIEETQDVVKQHNKQLAELHAKAVVYLNELDREDFKSSFGTIKLDPKWNVKLPPKGVNRQALFDEMKAKGVFDAYATIHAGGFKSWYMAEWKIAEEKGEGMGFKMAGVETPTLFEDLKFTKPK